VSRLFADLIEDACVEIGGQIKARKSLQRGAQPLQLSEELPMLSRFSEQARNELQLVSFQLTIDVSTDPFFSYMIPHDFFSGTSRPA